jgi:RNA polymerase sigma-70 factor (ECF subfamily)
LPLDVSPEVAEASQVMREERASPRLDPETRDLESIYRVYAADVSRWARRLRGPQGDVDDVLSEVFLVAQRRLPEFRGEARIGTWLYAITVRVVQEQRRKERWRRWLRLDRLFPAGPPAPPTPLEAFESRRATEITYRLLEELPEAERSALILFELEGLSGDEIAAVTGEPVGTIWVRLHRARTHFRQAYLSWERRTPKGAP